VKKNHQRQGSRILNLPPSELDHPTAQFEDSFFIEEFCKNNVFGIRLLKTYLLYTGIHPDMIAGIKSHRKGSPHKMMPPKLLITGSSGLIGKILWRGLADSFDLYGVDISPVEASDHVFRADISNPEQLRVVFERIPLLAYVVHLAGDPHADALWQSVLTNNIVGTKNVFEMAKEVKVRRVVFASSNHVTGAYEGFPPGLHTQMDPVLVTPQDPIRPDGYYGVSKAVGEAIARMYVERYGLESICLRIGSVLKDNDPTRDPRHLSTWLSYRDLVQLVKKSLSAKVRFGIYYGVSNNKKRFWDISSAGAEIGYHPEDDASAC
jgi:hypothetical protein